MSYAVRGERYIFQQALQIILVRDVAQDMHKDDLTQTEREVLKSIAQGKTTKEIAAERFSSIHTINSHRKNIFRKLNVNCAHDAMKYALRAGLVDETDFFI
jgi:DNA-binding NarL/FixJ family response regulator